jgi:ribonuclease T1
VEPPADWTGGTIPLAELPPEAIETLLLIAEGGPYPYRQDDGVFGNREGLLPDRPSGTYREYTVETPGSPDRGARRLVVGDDREVYYTDDHYESFRFVVP